MKPVLIGAIALAAVLAVPALSFAQTFAYVNTTGEVLTTSADTPAQALATAPNIGVHSGVMLIEDGSSDPVVGDTVPGV